MLMLATPLMAQDVEDFLSKYTSENGKKYMQPLADHFAANLNSGLFHNAKIKKFGFQMYLGLESQVSMIPSSSRVMTATTEGDYFPSTTIHNAPTIFGDAEGVKVEDPNSGLIYTFPGGLDMDMLPLAVPQLTIGSVFGTDFTIRYFGTDNVEDVGDIKLLGWGFRHNIDQYLKLPVNLSVGYYHQRFQFSDYLDAATNVINLQTSYSIPIITFYGGLGYETGSVDMAYEYVDDQTQITESIKFDLKPQNTVRLTLGIGFNLGPVKIHGDYNLAKISTFDVGLGIGIGEK